jgi:hypothetical protein
VSWSLQEPVHAAFLYLLDLQEHEQAPGSLGVLGEQTVLASEETAMPDERSTVFQQLKTFLTKQMRMSHLYQPLMLKTLIEQGGAASLREIALAFLAHDESQIEYYIEVTKRMPGPVLTRHQLVRREGEGYRLVPEVQQLTPDERGELLRLCDEAVENYTGRRGRKLCDHRRIALGDISGTARYEVLRRAGFRCDLCGISAEERALEVDHMLPRRHGGTDDNFGLVRLCRLGHDVPWVKA